MKKIFKVGSRSSPLAKFQVEWTIKKLKEKNPDVDFEPVWITTEGDKDRTSPLSSMGGKGVFVKEIEKRLVSKEIDFAVHSLKDMPQILPGGLELAPFPERADPRDAVLSRFGEWLRELPRGSTIGTGSPRRKAQILARYKKRYRVADIRGNVQTRIDKMNDGQVDAIVMAFAGLKRLGLDGEVTHVLEADEMLPAPGQGCLGYEFREEDQDLLAILSSIRHPESDAAARAERALLQGLGGSCFVPLGGLAEVKGSEIHLSAAVWDLEGERKTEARFTAPVDQPEWLGAKAAEKILKDGGAEILSEIG